MLQNRARKVLWYVKVSCICARQNPHKIIQIRCSFIEHRGMIFLPILLKSVGNAIGKLVQEVGKSPENTKEWCCLFTWWSLSWEFHWVQHKNSQDQPSSTIYHWWLGCHQKTGAKFQSGVPWGVEWDRYQFSTTDICRAWCSVPHASFFCKFFYYYGCYGVRGVRVGWRVRVACWARKY